MWPARTIRVFMVNSIYTRTPWEIAWILLPAIHMEDSIICTIYTGLNSDLISFFVYSDEKLYVFNCKFFRNKFKVPFSISSAIQMLREAVFVCQKCELCGKSIFFMFDSKRTLISARKRGKRDYSRVGSIHSEIIRHNQIKIRAW